jgi:PRTRC genetic system protein B
MSHTIPTTDDAAHVCPWRVPSEHAALIFVGEQILFRQVAANGALEMKFIAPASVDAAFAQTRYIDSGWLAPNIVRWGVGAAGQWAVLFVPPTVCDLTLATDASELVTVRVPMPGRVMLGYGTGYYLWAVTDEQLTATPTMFHAPLPNVDTAGRICFGAKIPPRASTATIQSAWNLFFSAPFTAHQANGKSKRHPNDVRAHLLALAQRNRRQYPASDLIPLQRTLDVAIQSFVRGYYE